MKKLAIIMVAIAIVLAVITGALAATTSHDLTKYTGFSGGEMRTYYFVDGELVTEEYFMENYPRQYAKWNQAYMAFFLFIFFMHV